MCNFNQVIKSQHILLHLNDLPMYKNSDTQAQRKCKVCKSKTAYYCDACSDKEHNQYFCLCRPDLRECWGHHMDNK